MASEKTKVIEWIFFQRFNAVSGELANNLVTMDDIDRPTHI